MSTENVWDNVMSSIIDKKSFFDVNSYGFEHELTTMKELINNCPGLTSQLVSWVNDLNGEPHRSDTLAANYRTLGNKFFLDPTKKQDPMALEFYTKALYASPLDSAEAALSHANRAAVLWRMNFYEEGYHDCEAALALKYPQDKMLKLLHRKKNLAVACKNPNYIDESVSQLVDCMKANDAATSEIEKVEKALLTKGSSERSAAIQQRPTQNKKLTEKFDTVRGRYITTIEKIHVDEPIFEEKAFAFVPVYNNYESNQISKHCENCAKTNVIPFPCYQCGRASYCSPRCQRVHNVIHNHECPGYEDNLWKRIGIAHLALRSLVVGFETVIKGTKFEERTTPLEFWNELMERSETDENFKYGQVLRLGTNFNKMDSADLLRYALTAAMLISHLNEKTFFFELYEEFYQIMSYNDWVLLGAALLMRHMGQLVSNGHAISDMEFVQPSDCGERLLLTQNSVAKGKLHGLVSSTRVFTAIFPKISLFNHSCDPNIRNCFEGSSLIVHATRDIPKDGEIFNCYGPNYKLMNQIDRKTSLKQQYCFDCDCTRCSANDQTYNKFLGCYCQNQQCRAPLIFSDNQMFWWCEDSNNADCQIYCQKCSQPFNTEISYLKIINRNLYMNPSFYTDDFRRQMLENYRKASTCLSEYHEHRQNFAQIILAADIPNDTSLCQSFADVILDNLNASRERFGSKSLEFMMAATYVLDFLAVTKERRHEWKDQAELNSLRLFDLQEITNSFSILSQRTRIVFQKYLEQSQ